MGSFSLGVDAWCKRGIVSLDVVGRKVGFEMGRRIIMRNPVRAKNGGRSRGNWQFAVGSYNENEIEGRDPRGAQSIARLKETVASWKVVSEASFYIFNNVPYIENLEHGSSKQAPAGMVAITIAEFGGIAEDAAAHARAGTFGGSRSEADMGSGWDVGGSAE